MILDPKVREKFFTISVATINRFLADTRKRQQIKGKSTTRPVNLLKKSISVRTYSDWDNTRPGFFEVDLVSHDGGNLLGLSFYLREKQDAIIKTICYAKFSKAKKGNHQVAESTLQIKYLKTEQR